MSRLTKDNPSARELVTGILDEELWWNTLKLVVEFLRAKAVEEVRVEFGFVLDRDLAGKEQGKNRTVRLADLEGYIRSGIEEGTIERKGSSDFLFYPRGAELAFMLCNDADFHFASSEPSVLADMAKMLSAREVKVYDSGRIV
jgi:hypothetical protein